MYNSTYQFYQSCQNMIATLENIMWHGEIPYR